MKNNRRQISLFLLFILGLTLGLAQELANITILQSQKDGPGVNDKGYEISPINDKIEKRVIKEPTIPYQMQIYLGNGGETSKNTSPDEIYFKKAELLQRLFPHLFIMKGAYEKKQIALTFDDGPDDKSTPQILNILEDYKIQSTFFLVGKNIQRYPNIVKKMVKQGHQIANHSWSHLRPTRLNNDKFIEEISAAKEILEDFVGLSKPYYYRPPYGIITPSQINLIDAKDYVTISWSIDSLDWINTNPQAIRDKVINSLHPGAIILMHSTGGKNNRQDTIKALPGIIEGILHEGYEFVTIDELIKKDH